MSESVFSKSVMEKLFAYGESAFDRIGEISGVNAEAAKKFGANQADLAEALLALGAKQMDLAGKAREPAEVMRAAQELGEGYRTAFDAYLQKMRSAADEVRSGYSKLLLGAFEEATVQ